MSSYCNRDARLAMSMRLEHQLLARVGLKTRQTSMGDGPCECDPRRITPLFKSFNTLRDRTARLGYSHLRCEFCATLDQQHPRADGKMVRWVSGALLIAPGKIIFWGDARFDNPEIEVRSATGEMSAVQTDLILNPPPLPWFFFSFAKANDHRDLRVTEDNSWLRFAGKMYMDRNRITEVDRDWVLALRNVGMTRQEWYQYFSEYVRDHEHTVRSALARIYPRLLTLHALPPVGSAEYTVLLKILR